MYIKLAILKRPKEGAYDKLPLNFISDIITYLEKGDEGG